MVFPTTLIKAVKGTRDLLPPSTEVWNRVEAVARSVFRAYNYHEIRTPILEETQLFARGVGAETDIVTKEMYTFTDRDESSLTLRPENTAPVIRAYIEHRLDQRPGVQKLYYIGPMFRRERPQKGRYRQFFQIGAEAIGSESPASGRGSDRDGDRNPQSASGLRDFKLLINSVGDQNCRPQYVERLREELQSRRRRHVRRLPAPRRDQSAARARLQSGGRPADHRPACRASSITSARLAARTSTRCSSISTDRGIEYEVRPRMVRGLDYYMRTTFEVVHGALGAQNSVLGGGRYDGLAESLGSKVHSPGIGFSIGEDRLVMSVEGEQQPAPLDLFIAPLGAPAVRHAAHAGARFPPRRPLRGTGGGQAKRAMELANKLGARYTLIVGETR